MKSIKYLLWSLALTAGGVFTACDVKDDYVPGQPDRDDCYRVYFPEQENTGSFNIDPEIEPVLTYTVCREVTADAITVPVTVTGADAQLFTIEPIRFEAGADETEFNITLSSDTELFTYYSVTLRITDPKYALQYSLYEEGSVALSLNVMRGLIHPLEDSWTVDDMYEIEKEDLFKTWLMWGVDFFDDSAERQPLAYVTFSENDEDFIDEEDDDEFYDLIDVEGLSLDYVEDDDTIQWEYYNGFILNFYMHDNLGQYGPYYLNILPCTAGGGRYGFYDEMMIGGLVDEGYMAMAYSGYYTLSSPEPAGFMLAAFSDEKCTSYLGAYEIVYNLMFEDPDVVAEEPESSSAKLHKSTLTTTKLNSMVGEMHTPANFVEKRGRERAYAIIDELRSRR